METTQGDNKGRQQRERTRGDKERGTTKEDNKGGQQRETEEIQGDTGIRFHRNDNGRGSAAGRSRQPGKWVTI